MTSGDMGTRGRGVTSSQRNHCWRWNTTVTTGDPALVRSRIFTGTLLRPVGSLTLKKNSLTIDRWTKIVRSFFTHKVTFGKGTSILCWGTLDRLRSGRNRNSRKCRQTFNIQWLSVRVESLELPSKSEGSGYVWCDWSKRRWLYKVSDKD